MDNLPPKEISDEYMINQAFQQLLNDYLSTKHRKKVEIITKAFNFANQAHKGIKRRSGEPYIMHPIAVASIVCNEIGLGSTSICAALLHDVVEDTDYTVEDIENIFGPKIAQIVDGLTKISGGIFGDRASAQAENFKKLLLTMSNDIRVILIKIADRLHNMRTLGSMLPNKQYKIAGETLYIYAPLANRLGLYKIKTELENLSFKYEHPEEYAEIEEKLNATAAERDKVFNDFTAPIRNVVHPFATDLDFDPLPVVTHKSHVQCLVAVCFGMAYPIAQAIRVRLIYFGDRYIDVKTIIEFFFHIAGLENNPDRQQVIDLFERNMLGLHLVPV